MKHIAFGINVDPLHAAKVSSCWGPWLAAQYSDRDPTVRAQAAIFEQHLTDQQHALNRLREVAS